MAKEGSALVQTAPFTNTYNAKGKATLKIKKELGELSIWPKDKTAVFKLTAEDGTPMPTTEGGDTVTLTSADVGYFGEIEYPLSSAGKTYTYTITETSDFGAGWTKTGPITATVAVGNDNKTGTLATSVTYDPDSFKVINTYDAEGSIPLKGTKKFKYGQIDTETSTFKETFTFSVYNEADYNAAIGLGNRNESAFINYLQDKKVSTATTSGIQVVDGTATFNFNKELEYTLADISISNHGEMVNGHLTKNFDYVVVEDIPATAEKKTVDGKDFYYDSSTDSSGKKRDIKYDATEYHVTITVTDKGDGTLDVRTSEEEEGPLTFDFVNEKIYTRLLLTKNIDSIVTGDTDGELTNVTCVFKVSYRDPILGVDVGRTVNVQFDAANVKAEEVWVDKIPIDATVNVAEVYSADYRGEPRYAAAIRGTDPKTGLPLWTATFDNKRKGDITGSGVINKVKQVDNSDSFVITNRRDSTGKNPPPSSGASDNQAPQGEN